MPRGLVASPASPRVLRRKPLGMPIGAVSSHPVHTNTVAQQATESGGLVHPLPAEVDTNFDQGHRERCLLWQHSSLLSRLKAIYPLHQNCFRTVLRCLRFFSVSGLKLRNQIMGDTHSPPVYQGQGLLGHCRLMATSKKKVWSQTCPGSSLEKR